MRPVFPAILATLAAPVVANAQSLVATNLASVASYRAPPLGFDAEHASDAALASFGLPPRPDAAHAPDLYAVWRHAVSRAPARIVPHLKTVRQRHDVEATFNWAGFSVQSAATASTQSNAFSVTYLTFVMPTVSEPAGTCSNGWLYASFWTGIDGASNQDVLQAGADGDYYCNQAGRYPIYFPWFEWAPAYTQVIQNLRVAPGNSMFLTVWATGPTTGHAYVQNVSTNQAVSVLITPPAGTSLQGSSAEWIVERPEINKALGNLDHFTTVTMNGWARDVSGAYWFPVQVSPPDTNSELYMVNIAGRFLASPTAISGSVFSVASTGQ